MKNDHLVTAQSFANVAKSLAASSEVQLFLGGTSARTDGRNIHLPLMREMDKEMSEITLGFLVHEIAHIRYTDFKLDFDGFFNVFEDIRIEKKIRQKLKGAEPYFQKKVDFAISLRLEQSGDTDPIRTVASWLILHAQVKVLGRRIKQPEILQKADSDLCSVWGDIRPLLDRYLEKSKYLTDCASAKQLSEDLIRELSKQESLQGNQQGESQQGNQQGESQQGNQQGESQQGNQQGNQQGESQNASSGNGFSALISKGVCAEDSNDLIKKMLNEMFSDNAEQIIQNQHEIREIAGVQAGISKMPATKNTVLMTDVKVVKKSLTRAVKVLVESETREARFSTKRGKIDTKRLARTGTGQRDIFYKKKEGRGIDTAVTIAVDMSSSMNKHNRAEYALTSTLALIDSLQSVSGVSVRSTLFPGITSGQHVEQCVGRGQKPNPNITGLYPKGGTPLIEAVNEAKDELLMTQARKRVLIVITDAVVDGGTAKWAENIAEKHGVDARFICINPRQMLFKKGIEINDPKDLGAALLKSARTLFV